MNKQKTVLITCSIIALTVLLSSCLPGAGSYSPLKPAGFFTGIWHGWIAPFSLIIGLFKSNVSIYESFNTGWWYDFGFYISIIAGFGSIQFFRKKRG